jgi:ectoine hydroxylase
VSDTPIQPTIDDPYTSREDGLSEMAERRDPVVWGTGDGPLTREELDRYDRDGFLVFPGRLADETVTALWEEARRLTVAYREAGNEAMITEPESEAVRSVFAIHDASGPYRDLIASPALAGVARQLLGSEVGIFQSRINFKPGFDGKEFYWHSDFETWHMEDGMPRMRAVSASVLLTESNAFNGPLLLIPGSHRTYVRCPGKTPENHHTMSLKKQEYGVPAREMLTRLVREHGIRSATGPAGTIVFFECNMMHGSAGNMTPYPRNGLFLVFNSMENPLQAPFAGIPPRPGFLAERRPVPVR